MSIHNNKKDRREKPSGNQNVWIYGRHAADAALNNPARKILRIVATQNMLAEWPELNKKKIPIETKDIKAMDLMFSGATHQGIALEARQLPDVAIEDIFEGLNEIKRVIVLDQVTDPHNVGAILRSAAAFNVGAVIMTKDNSPSESTALAKAASGALEVVPLVKVTNLAAAMKTLKEKDFWCVGLAGDAKTEISKMPDYDKVALIFGAEGVGLRRLTAENCDLLVKLPISDKVESLNVSNAAAIALYQLSL